MTRRTLSSETRDSKLSEQLLVELKVGRKELSGWVRSSVCHAKLLRLDWERGLEGRGQPPARLRFVVPSAH